MSLPAGPAVLPNLIQFCQEAASNAERLLGRASAAVRAKVLDNGVLSADAIEREQHACHGLAWLATYAEAIKQMAAYAERLSGENRFGEIEALLTQVGVGEYVTQVLGGIPMSQSEMVRFHELELTPEDRDAFATPAVTALIKANSPEARARLAELIRHAEGSGGFGDGG